MRDRNVSAIIKNKNFINSSVVTVFADYQLQNQRNKLTLLSQHLLHPQVIVVPLVLDHLVRTKKVLPHLLLQVVPQRFDLATHRVPLAHSRHSVHLQVVWGYLLFLLSFLFTLLFLLVSWLALNAALHVPKQNTVALLLKCLLFFVNTFLVTFLAKAFVLLLWCVVFLPVCSLFASLLLFLFTVLILLASGCAVLLLQGNSLWQQFVYFFAAWVYAFLRKHRCWCVFLKTYSWIVLWNQFNFFLSAVFLLLFEHICASRSHWCFFSWISWWLFKLQWWLLVFDVSK